MKRKPTKDIDLESFINRFASETDRAAAVLGASLLDVRLEEVFREKFAANHNALLGPSGTLATFSSRINLAFALQWIDADTAHDLNVIRDIRNDFAHHLDHELSFETQSISDRCCNLQSSAASLRGYAEAAKHNPNFSTAIFDGIVEKFSAPRWRYHIAIESLNHILCFVEPTRGQAYAGPALINEIYQAAARTRIRITATGDFGSPDANVSQEMP
jgi:hypothetical protein